MEMSEQTTILHCRKCSKEIVVVAVPPISLSMKIADALVEGGGMCEECRKQQTKNETIYGAPRHRYGNK